MERGMVSMHSNVLHVVIAKTWGGGEQYVYDICSEMKKIGRECFVAVDSTNILFQERYAKVARVIPTNLYLFGGLLSVYKLKSIVKNNNIKIVNCHSGHALLSCLLLKKLTSVLVVMFKHNALSSKRDFYHLWQMRNTDAYICVSKLVYDLQVNGLNKSYAKKYHLVYNGIDINKFNKYDKKQFKNNKPFIVGYAGRLTKDKGIDLLIKAFADLHKCYPDTLLTIAGEDEKGYINTLKELVSDLGLDDYVVFCGLVYDMESFYKGIDVLVLPSIVAESFGLVICEAIYCGTVVITTDSGAQREILTNNDYGYIIKRGEVLPLLDVLKNVYNKRQPLKDDGTDYITKNFSSKACVDKLLDIYYKLLN